MMKMVGFLRGVVAAIVMTTSACVATNVNADVITRWTFETSIPTTGGPLTPEEGSGTATSNTGGTFSNPAGWGSIESWSSNGWNVGEFFQFQVSTVGFESISLNWQHTGSNTGPANFDVQYSLDGSSFTNFSSYAVTNDGWNTTVTPAASERSADLSSISSLNEASSVFFRLTVSNDIAVTGGTVASTGTSRVDNFTVNGISSVPEPASMLLLGVVGFGGLAFRRFRGKLSSNESVAI